LIIDNNTKSQLFSSENYRKSYDSFQYDLMDTVGASFGDNMMHNLSPALLRLAKGTIFSNKADEISAEDAQAKYGLGGALKFDSPVSDSYARGIMETKIKEMRNQQILDKGQKGFVAGTAKLGSGVVASVLDPVNIASAFIPIGRVLTVLGAAKLVGSRTLGASITRGSFSGAVGAAIVEPIPLYSAKQYQLDYDMTDSLMNIVFGGVIGGGAHGIGSIFSSRAEARAADRSLKDLTFDKQKEVFTKNLDAFFDDKLPRVSSDFIKDSKQNLRAEHLTDAEFLRAIPDIMESKWSEALKIKQSFSELKGGNKVSAESLTQFIKNNGGIIDAGGDMAGRDINLPGLFRKQKATIGTDKGVRVINNNIDAVRERVFDAGFFPEKNSYDEITNDDLFKAIEDDLSGKKRYRASDRAIIEDDAAQEAAFRSMEESGFSDDMTVGQIFDELAAREFEIRQSVEADVFNEPFPDHHLFDDTREDLFLETDSDFYNPVEMTDIEKQVADLDLEVKNTLENMDESARADYEETFKEIGEELKVAQSLKDDLSNLVSCVWAA
jgi:hypothetical protein